MQWLEEIEAESLEYLRGAYARDKKEGVSFFSLFSCHEQRQQSNLKKYYTDWS